MTAFRTAAICRALLGAALALATAAMPAHAQGPLLEPVQFAPRGDPASRSRGGVEGRFDYYSLVLSWSPTYCAGEARPNDTQCRPRARPFAFVLHGLWPQYERGYPEYCPTRDRPFVPQSTIDRMQDIMPSRNLIDPRVPQARRVLRASDRTAISRCRGGSSSRSRCRSGSPSRLRTRWSTPRPSCRSSSRPIPACAPTCWQWSAAVRATGCVRCACASRRKASSAPVAATRTSAGCAPPRACSCPRCAPVTHSRRPRAAPAKQMLPGPVPPAGQRAL